jgi:hypothetical protein
VAAKNLGLFIKVLISGVFNVAFALMGARWDEAYGGLPLSETEKRELIVQSFAVGAITGLYGEVFTALGVSAAGAAGLSAAVGQALQSAASGSCLKKVFIDALMALALSALISKLGPAFHTKGGGDIGKEIDDLVQFVIETIGPILPTLLTPAFARWIKSNWPSANSFYSCED